MEYKLGFPSLLLLTLAIAFLIAAPSSHKYLTAWLYTFFILVPSYYVIYQSWIYPFYISPLRFVPTVPGFPLWGHIGAIITEEAGVPYRRWHKQHGPIIRYFSPFGRPRLSVTDDQALKQITVRNPYVWQKPPPYRNIMRPILGQGVLLVEGDTHVQQRKMLAPAFSTSSIKALSPIFWRKALSLSRVWQDQLRTENVSTKSIEVLDWLSRVTLDIIGQAGFGADLDSLNCPETPIRQAYQRYLRFDTWGRLHHGLQSQTRLVKYLPMRPSRELEAGRRTLRSFASDIIRDKQSKPLSREKDIIALIVRKNNNTTDGESNGKMSFEAMRDQVTTFLGAGHDSTATAMAWTLHLLSKHPSAQEKLRTEIQQYMPFLFTTHSRADESRLATMDEDRLPYLNNVCRESLRYIPPFPFTMRHNTVDDTLCGYRIPAGTLVSININTINRVPLFWGDNADEFDPDRWDRLPDTHTANAYMSFLHGPRGCIGKKFAETEMKTLLCCLLSLFRFEIDDGVVDPEEWKMWKIALRPRYGITLKVTPLVGVS